MRWMVVAAMVGSSLIVTVPAAEAKGCIKGAIVGGVAGHFAGHHGLMGAAAGCAVGHHYANKQKNAPASGQTPDNATNQPAQ